MLLLSVARCPWGALGWCPAQVLRLQRGSRRCWALPVPPEPCPCPSHVPVPQPSLVQDPQPTRISSQGTQGFPMPGPLHTLLSFLTPRGGAQEWQCPPILGIELLYSLGFPWRSKALGSDQPLHTSSLG